MGITFKICKICDTAELRIEGMQNRKMERDECCVFSYETETQPKFWGKNTPQCLWVSLISGGRVVDSKKIMKMDETPVCLSGRGNIAIESRRKIQVGSNVLLNGDEVIVI